MPHRVPADQPSGPALGTPLHPVSQAFSSDADHRLHLHQRNPQRPSSATATQATSQRRQSLARWVQVGVMDLLPPAPENLIAAILWHQRRMESARAEALEAVRVYADAPTPANLVRVVGAQVRLSYRQDDLAALQVECLRVMKRRLPH